MRGLCSITRHSDVSKIYATTNAPGFCIKLKFYEVLLSTWISVPANWTTGDRYNERFSLNSCYFHEIRWYMLVFPNFNKSIKYLLEVYLSKNVKLKLYKPIVRLSFRPENTCCQRIFLVYSDERVMFISYWKQIKDFSEGKKGKTFFCARNISWCMHHKWSCAVFVLLNNVNEKRILSPRFS